MFYRPKRKYPLWVDLSPLIDVVFLLLIFFMVSTRFKDDHGLDLNLPQSESQQAKQSDQLTIAVDQKGTILLGEREISMEALKEGIQAELAKLEKKMVVLKVDKNVSHGVVVSVMDAAKTAGAEGITFAAQAKKAEKR